MTKYLLAITLSVGFLISASLEAQTAKDVFDSDVKLTWCGVDFSLAKFVGPSQDMKLEIVERDVPNWNALLELEKNKYDVGKFTDKGKVKYDLNIASTHNDALDFSDAVTTKSGAQKPLTTAEIQTLMSTYDFGEASGLAMIMVVESFNKYKEEGIIWVTFVNAGSKSIIFSERVIAKPGGFGFKNYWAKTIFNALEITKDEWNIWKRKYAVKK